MGFCVLRVKAEGHRDLATVVGSAPSVSAGEWITAAGSVLEIKAQGSQNTNIPNMDKTVADPLSAAIGRHYPASIFRYSAFN